MKTKEHDEQAAFIAWVDMQVEYPELKRIFAIPNGGHRNVITAKKMKAEGVRRGVPDLFLPLPRQKPDGTWFHGLYLEAKIRPNKPSNEQGDWIAFLKEHDYAVVVCYGYEELKATTEWYMDL